jgi:CBS domain-containing protein
MTVARILREKGRDVLTTQPHRTIKEVATLLGSRGVGAVVVADAVGAVLGIISERDIVRAIGAAGEAALADPVSRHMTARVSTVGEEATIDHVMRTMTEGRFRHMPVVENGRLVGIVSIGDIVKRHVDALHHESEALREYIASA